MLRSRSGIASLADALRGDTTGSYPSGFTNLLLFRGLLQRPPFFQSCDNVALPALLSFRLGFGCTGVATGAGGSASPLILAHLAFCPRAIFRIPAAEILCFLGVVSGVGTVSAEPPDSMARSSAIWESICVFCALKPSIAAVITSGVSFGGMSLFRESRE